MGDTVTTTEIKLFTSDGKALTNLTSADETICLPDTICVNSDGTATSSHADSNDAEYESLSDLAKFGCNVVEYDGKSLILTQDAYADVDPRDTKAGCYLASAVDTDGNQYRVVWYPYDDFDGDDEGDACDWDNPDRVEAL